MDAKWIMRFLEMAELTATWSKDPNKKVGAVIVDSNRRVLSVGYNGLPQGMDDSLISDKEWKLKRIVHAEINAIANCPTRITDAYLFITHPPCSECAKNISAYGFKGVYFLNKNVLKSPHWNFDVSSEIFSQCGIELKGM